jgi:hypothetical protein
VSGDLTPSGDAAVRLALTTAELKTEVARLHAGIALALETTYWDRPYDTRINAIRAELEELL